MPLSQQIDNLLSEWLLSIHEELIEQISCDLITSTSTYHIFKTTADRGYLRKFHMERKKMFLVQF